MPMMELYEDDVTFLETVEQAPTGILRRGFFGWKHPSWRVRPLVDHGYLQLLYDWKADRPALKMTMLGRSRLEEERSRYMVPVA